MKKFLISISIIFNVLTGFGQGRQTIKLEPEQIESLFLTNNLELIASKFNIDIADAAIAQAKLWDNPVLSVGNMNLWSTKNQRDGIKDMASPFAKNTEFTVELSQLIQTANKKGRLVRREKMAKEIALQEFEEVTRGLKAELRESICEMQYLQSYIVVLNNQRRYLAQLNDSYKKQVAQGNIAKSELLRLQSSLLELDDEINETRAALNEQAKSLKIRLNLPPLTDIEIAENQRNIIAPDTLILTDLFAIAGESRPDLKMYDLQTRFFQKSLDYERSMRVPDLTISATYDRYGGVWKDFAGIGVSVDLPFFNRNQGNIKAAKLGIEQYQYRNRQRRNVVQHEITASYNNYAQAYYFYRKINDDGLLAELDSMLDAYTRNLVNRNISMLEYIDFMDAYKTNKQILLNARKKVAVQFEELQYNIGTDIK